MIEGLGEGVKSIPAGCGKCRGIRGGLATRGAASGQTRAAPGEGECGRLKSPPWRLVSGMRSARGAMGKIAEPLRRTEINAIGTPNAEAWAQSLDFLV